MKTIQKLIALVMAMAIITACTFASAQDTLDVYTFSKESATLSLHLGSNQSLVAPHDEIYVYADNGFYITTGCVHDQIVCSGCMAYYSRENDYYFIIPVSHQIEISFGGETFKINIRKESELK